MLAVLLGSAKKPLFASLRASATLLTAMSCATLSAGTWALATSCLRFNLLIRVIESTTMTTATTLKPITSMGWIFRLALGSVGGAITTTSFTALGALGLLVCFTTGFSADSSAIASVGGLGSFLGIPTL